MHPIITQEVKTNEYWNTNEIRKKYLDNYNKSDKVFTVYDGPPFATGLPHYGHFLAGSIKDTIIRYKSLQGYKINKIAGWDCHGVPMEMAVNKELNINSKDDVIKKVGIDNYCKKCKESVLTCADNWKTIMNRYGRWADFENPYTTMDFEFCKKVWEVFSIVNEAGLLSQGYRINAYSTGLETSLSNFESSLNYKMRSDQSLTFLVKLNTNLISSEYDHYIAVYTTTPWTLPGNYCIAINQNDKYGYKIVDNKIVISSDKDGYINGSDLIGITYEPLFDFTKEWFGNKPSGFYQIYHGDFVNKDTGTGAVHIAPLFGEDDFNLCIKNNIISSDGNNLYDYLDSVGSFIPSVGKYFDENYTNTICFQMSNKIIKYIKTKMTNNFYKSEQINHSYPHCWRTDTPLIYRAQQSWIIKVSSIKNELVELNKQINWIPDHVGSGRFNQWLENVKDWNISRSRFWGIPIPVWKEIDGNDYIIIKSVDELDTNLTDLHRNSIDNIIIERNGKKYKRISEVFDCWFESGCVPYYFSNEKYIPADFIAEGLDQTRGWFYTSFVLGYICSKQLNKEALTAFKNVMVNGLILAKDGKKMSKSLNNYTDPMLIIDKYGADALRLYLLSSPAVKAEDLKFDDNGVNKQMKNILIPYYNTIKFIETYRKLHQDKLDSFKNMGFSRKLSFPLNSWIMEKMNELETRCYQNYENYRIDSNIYMLADFVEILNNGYIKLNRPIIKNQSRMSELNEYTIESIHVVYIIMFRLAYIMAPIAPYFAEYLYQTVKPVLDNNLEDSIHLTIIKDIYNIETNRNDIDYCNSQFKLLDQIRKFRSNNNFAKVRPFKKIIYNNSELTSLTDEFKEEINSLDIEIKELDSNNIRLTPILNDKEIYNNHKKDGNQVKRIIMELDQNELLQLKNGIAIIKEFEIIPTYISNWNYCLIDNNIIANSPNDVNIKQLIGADYIITIDTSYNNEMQNLVLVQNVARQFQKMRKYAGLNPWDPVVLRIKVTEKIKNILSDNLLEFKNITNRDLEFIKDQIDETEFFHKMIYTLDYNEEEYDVELYLSKSK